MQNGNDSELELKTITSTSHLLISEPPSSRNSLSLLPESKESESGSEYNDNERKREEKDEIVLDDIEEQSQEIGLPEEQFTTQVAYKHPTLTRKELWSWYSYDFANSVYSSVAISVLIPLLLDSLAFSAGFNPEDGGPCIAANQTTGEPQKCRVVVGNTTMDNTAYSLYMISISVGIQAFMFISLGALADYGSLRKGLLLFFAFLGGVVSILFLATTGQYILAGVFTILSNVCFGVSIVFYNAYLPLLIEAHPQMRELEAKKDKTMEEIAQKSQELSSKISTRGFIWGYVSGTALLIISCVILLLVGQDSIVAMQWCIALSGIWWIAFTIPPAIFLKSRSGEPIPGKQFFLFFSWKQIILSFLNIKKIPLTFLFLFCYFIFSDAYSTITSVAVLFGRRELHMSNTKLIIIAIIAPFMAAIGNFIFLFIERRFKFQTKTMLIVNLILLSLIPIYGMIGFAENAPFGIIYEGEMYGIAVLYGFCLGAVQSYSRVFFAELIPPGQESEFFGLYEITDKGSAWIGTAIVGAITDNNLNIRYGFIYMIFALLLPIPAIWYINLTKGKEQAIKLTSSKKS